MTDKTRRELIVTAGALVTTGVLAGCSEMTQSQGGNVSISNEGFDPCNLEISSGSSVSWENESDSRYTLLSASDNWDMEAEMPAGSATNYEFGTDGVYVAELEEMNARMKIAVGSADLESQAEC